MASLSVDQIIIDAQRMADRVRDLDVLSSDLLVEAEGNNRFVESLRQFQDDLESLNEIANSKTNAEMVNRIQQQNASSLEILKENRELKICIEDYERAMELIMQKYREHTKSKILCSKINFKEVYNEKLWNIIHDQRQKINEMAAVMQRAAAVDDNCDLENMTKLRLENQSLRELLQISKQFGTFTQPIRYNEYLLEEKAVQTDNVMEALSDALSESSGSIESRPDNLETGPMDIESTNREILLDNTASPPKEDVFYNNSKSNNDNNNNENTSSNSNDNNNVNNINEHYSDSNVSNDSLDSIKQIHRCITNNENNNYMKSPFEEEGQKETRPENMENDCNGIMEECTIHSPTEYKVESNSLEDGGPSPSAESETKTNDLKAEEMVVVAVELSEQQTKQEEQEDKVALVNNVSMAAAVDTDSNFT